MTISFARYQFPPTIIRHAVWLYVRFTLSYRDVEDLHAHPGVDAGWFRLVAGSQRFTNDPPTTFQRGTSLGRFCLAPVLGSGRWSAA